MQKIKQGMQQPVLNDMRKIDKFNSSPEAYLRVLNQFAIALTKITTIDDLAWYVAKEVVGGLGFSDCVFYLFNEENQSIVQYAAIADKNPNGHEIINPLTIKLGEGVTGSVAQSQTAEIVSDVSIDSRYVLDVVAGGSEICVPMIHNGKLLGVIDCEDRRKFYFDHHHLEILTTVAAYSSAKIAERQAQKIILQNTEDLKQKVISLTEMREALKEAKTKAEENSSMKTRFVATISHEIRTPLNGILGSLDLLLDEDLPPKASALVEMAQASGDSLHTLLTDVIDFARFEAGRMKLETNSFSIRELLSSLQAFWQPHIHAHDCSLEMMICPEVSNSFLGDAARIRQILNNYISNALKYSKSKRILLTVDWQLSISGDPAKELRFSIQDFGEGIPLSEQSLLFNAFSQVGDHKDQVGKGAGLGLAICKQVAELMKGCVGLDSSPGEGATFWLQAPLQSIKDEAKGQVQKEIETQNFITKYQKTPRVLVAEDIPTNQIIVKMMLNSFGARVTIANNGVEAVEMASFHPFDIIFMDIGMPEMGGLEASDRIRSIEGPNSKTPIFAFTAHGMEEDRIEFEQKGMQGIVTKPVKKQDLYNAVDMILTDQTAQN